MSVDGCCSYPHGRKSIVATVLSLIALGLASSSSGDCRFVTTPVNFSDRLNTDGERTFGAKRGAGILSYQDYAMDPYILKNQDLQCYEYSQEMLDEMDGAYRASRAFAMLAFLCMGFGTLFIIFMSCIGYTRTAIKGIASLFFVGSLFEILTMVFFASNICDEGCTFSNNATLAIIAFVVSIVTGALVMYIPEPLPLFDPYVLNATMEQAPPVSSPGTQTMTETKFPDGSKKIIKTTVHADGSQTVEETFVSP